MLFESSIVIWLQISQAKRNLSATLKAAFVIGLTSQLMMLLTGLLVLLVVVHLLVQKAQVSVTTFRPCHFSVKSFFIVLVIMGIESLMNHRELMYAYD